MYASIITRRIIATVLMAGVMAVFVYWTFVAKEHYFGSTPIAHTITTASRYFLDSLLAGVRSRGGSAFAAALAAFGIESKEAEKTRGPAKAIPVLTYHRIVQDADDLNNVTLRTFRDQMYTLHRAGWRTVSLKDFEAFMAGSKELPERSFLITFDDGAKESFYPVDPIFQELDMQGVAYIIVSASHTEESTYYLSPQEIRFMLTTGRWDIGSHSYDAHRPYPTDTQGHVGLFYSDKLWLPEAGRIETEEEFTARVHKDLARSREELGSTYGIPINTFAFPLGNETGIQGSSNFPEGTTITEREASAVYAYGFLQTNNHQFTATYPGMRPFIVYRIHVNYDWDGQRLLSILENGLPKNLPFEDDFAASKGWLASWGTLDSGRHNLQLQASPSMTSASTFLDGSLLWKNYSYDAALDWDTGHVFLLANVRDSRSYDACVFSPGKVQIQTTVGGETKTLSEKAVQEIAYGTNVRPGIRVHDSVIECSWDFASIAETYERVATGGIGLQIWDPALGKAQVKATSIIVRPILSTSSPLTL